MISITKMPLVGADGAIDEMWITPDDWVALGGVLPPNRPEGGTFIHIKDGQSEWWTKERES
jgi:hypothetical protein